MLAIVQDEQRLAAGQELAQPLEHAAGSAVLGHHVQGSRRGGGHRGVVADRGQLDEPHPVGVAAKYAARDLDRQPRFPRSTYAHDGHDPAGLQQ